jgi:choline dehydrogenase-like flavoprotein
MTRVLGGSSSINGLIYVRGRPEDSDHWAPLGNLGELLDYARQNGSAVLSLQQSGCGAAVYPPLPNR